MAISLPNVAVEQFADNFDNEYQANKPLLPSTIMNEHGVVGKVFHRSVAGEIVLHDRGASQSDIPPSDVTYRDVLLTFENKTALVPSDIFDQAEVKANERVNLARSSAMGIARAEDQIVINALEATTTTTIAAGGTGLTVAKLRAAKAQMDRDNVPPQDRTMAIHANSLETLLAQTETTSSDFNTIRALVDGQLNTFLGFTFKMLGDRTEGGLPITVGLVRTNFAYHRDSMIMAWGVLSRVANPGVEVDFDTRSRSWLVIPSLRAGAKNILPEGVVKIDSQET